MLNYGKKKNVSLLLFVLSLTVVLYLTNANMDNNYGDNEFSGLTKTNSAYYSDISKTISSTKMDTSGSTTTSTITTTSTTSSVTSTTTVNSFTKERISPNTNFINIKIRMIFAEIFQKIL